MHYIVINFKTYPEGSGENAVRLAEIVSQIEVRPSIELIICPQAADIFRVRERFPDLKIWAQHIDDIEPGRNTGWASAENLVMAGANGTLINHSEHQLPLAEVEDRIVTAKKYGLTSCVAVENADAGRDIAILSPDIIAYEPSDLISGNQAITDVDPTRAEEFVSRINSSTPLLLGAGVRQAADVKAAVDYGFSGVLISSGFIKADNPAIFLEQLLTGFAQVE